MRLVRKDIPRAKVVVEKFNGARVMLAERMFMGNFAEETAGQILLATVLGRLYGVVLLGR